LRHLVPQLDELTSASAAVDEAQVLEFIHRTTMVGLLPVPHPIGPPPLPLPPSLPLTRLVIRKYQPNKYTSLWFTAFMWGVIFMHNQVTLSPPPPRASLSDPSQEIPLFDGRTVRLFMVQTVA
jgi:hypothetical protein